MRIPRATYRFQFNEIFRLPDALALVPYLHELGVSHVYASPLFVATPHSPHGYNVCDFETLNPELGTEADLEKVVHALQARNMGLVLDIVPNHMGIGSPDNFWWWDVLTHGEKSEFAGYFDIDWKPAEKQLHGKILVPILSDQYQTLLSKGAFQLLFENGRFLLSHHEHRFPLAPRSVSNLPTDEAGLNAFNSDLAALNTLIQKQHYVLEFFGLEHSKLNYRRFFAISSLAAVRVEDEKVFNLTHSLVRKWFERGWLDGLRVDHPDGLRDPQQYLERLRRLAPNAWIVVEKILEPGEQLPANWPVQGTTGYDFLNQVNGLFVHPSAERDFTGFYAEFTGEPTEYVALAHAKKRDVLKTLFTGELNSLTCILVKIAARRAKGKHFTSDDLHDALAEIIVNFPVYRSYITGTNPASTGDAAVVKNAIQLACEARKDLSSDIFAFIRALLLSPQSSIGARNFVARFQQLTGPVMAKSVEDTAFYCFNRFTSLNEVGGDPECFGTSLESFHQFLLHQQRGWPYAQLTSSTHDTKRAEDVRARMNVLSEIPELWADTVRRWSKMNECHRQNDLPDRNAEYLFYQTLAGAWPISEERAQCYMEKAALECKQHTTWSDRNQLYEKALSTFISETLRDPQFTNDLEHFIAGLTEASTVNSLAQTLIKLTAAGVPDIYQGCELWDFSLVDPDNRRSVDFKLRQRLLAEAKHLSPEAIWNRRADGIPKLWLIKKTLKLRERFPDFPNCRYEPLFANGPGMQNIMAFSREKIITIVPRFLLKLNRDWQNTSVELPQGNWRNEFTEQVFNGGILAEELFRKFPVALLTQMED